MFPTVGGLRGSEQSLFIGSSFVGCVVFEPWCKELCKPQVVGSDGCNIGHGVLVLCPANSNR